MTQQKPKVKQKNYIIGIDVTKAEHEALKRLSIATNRTICNLIRTAVYERFEVMPPRKHKNTSRFIPPLLQI